MKAIMVTIGGGMVGRKDFPIILVEVSLDFQNSIEFPTLLYLFLVALPQKAGQLGSSLGKA